MSDPRSGAARPAPRTTGAQEAGASIAIVTVTWANGINATGGNSGYELNLALGFLALVPAVFGAGRFSVDAMLERRLLRADTASATRA